jgi:hypothetical protein
MNSKTRKMVFMVFAALAFAAMLYHTIGAVQPFDATPVWRHTLFIGINTICIFGLLKRPKWFVWFWGILTIQQLYSHGSHFINLLQQHKFNFIDAGVVLLMPIIFILLLKDKKSTIPSPTNPAHS